MSPPLRSFTLVAALVLVACAEEPATVECSNDLDCGAGELCRDSACVAPVDPCAPSLSCGGGCVDPMSSGQNCGACGNDCGEGVSCAGGSCCPAGAEVACGGVCTDLRSNPLHCGLCGLPCDDGLLCSHGGCCAPGEEFCGGQCRTIATDPVSCGGCGNLCASGAACADGVCQQCPAGTTETDCGGVRACIAPALVGPPCRVEIPAGSFTRGANTPDTDYEPEAEVTLRGFSIDLLETTQAEYQGCVEAGACPTPEIFDPARTPTLPVTWLVWDAADGYCRWRNARLPTEAEWEKAARGDAPGYRNFPWGDAAPDCVNSSYFRCAFSLEPVGSHPYGASPYGLLDAAGNAQEWVADWYARDAYETGPLVDPTGPADGTEKVQRGGSTTSGVLELGVMNRSHFLPEIFHSYSGVRCAQDLP